MSQLIESISGQFDRLPPHSIDSELCLLASMMLDRDVLGEVLALVASDDFYQADHQIIFDLVVGLFRENAPIDAVIVREELIKRQLFEEVGGNGMLAAILGSVPSAAHGAHYAKIVREKSVLRQLISASNDILRDAYAPHEQADQVLDRAQRRVFEIVSDKNASRSFSSEEILQSIFDEFDRVHTAGEEMHGLHTGYVEIDDMLNGLHDGEMIVVAARPSVGKTALSMNIAEHIACVTKKACGIFSLEMSKDELMKRMLCSRAKVLWDVMRKGKFTDDQRDRLTTAWGELSAAPITIDDSSTLTAIDLRVRARKMKRDHDIKLLVIDYMQLMDDPAGENRQQQVSTISRTIKSVARELNIPVIVISQLNRASEGREGHRPRLSELRESGSIEQDADVVVLLHRDDRANLGDPNYTPDRICEAIIAKQRNGPCGMVRLTDTLQFMRFENYMAPAAEDMF